MRNAVEAIFAELREKGVSYDDCRIELQQEILKNFKKRNVEKLLPKLISLARDVIYETFERSEHFAGNLDARAIREAANSGSVDTHQLQQVVRRVVEGL